MVTEHQDPPATGVQGELRQDRFVGGQDLTRWTSPGGRALARAVRKVSSILGPHATLILTLAVGAVIAAALTALFSEVYESVVDADGVAGLDHPVLDAAKGARSPTLDLIITGYTDIGGICSILLPEYLICLFTTNEQSLDGVKQTMQLARKLYLTPTKVWRRKIEEAFLAVELEKRLSKEQILTYNLTRK